MKEEIGIEVTFTLEIKLQKFIFQQKPDPFLAANFSYLLLVSLLGQECAYVCHEKRTEKEGNKAKVENKKLAISVEK